VRLSRPAPEAEQPAPEQDAAPLKDAEHSVAAADVYRVYFHGPAYQVVDRAWRYDGGCIGRLAADLPPDHVPETAPTVVEPRLVELCFQTAGLWQAGREGVLGLPLHIDAVRVLADPVTAAGGRYAIVRPDGDRYDCAVVDEHGTVLVYVEGYRTIALPGRLADDARAPVAAAMAE
jgi:polyketide synthase-like dehydratase family protein